MTDHSKNIPVSRMTRTVKRKDAAETNHHAPVNTPDDIAQIIEDEQYLYDLITRIHEKIKGSAIVAEFLLGKELIEDIATQVAMGPDPRFPA
jgi:hypothetical protein